MVEFNPNAHYSVKHRKVDGQKTEIKKQDGKYYIENEKGENEQLIKTRKGNLFHKAEFTRAKSNGIEVEKSIDDNPESSAETKALRSAVNADQIEEMKRMKEQSQSQSGNNEDLIKSFGEFEMTVTKTKGDPDSQTFEFKKGDKDKDIALIGGSMDEWVVTSGRGVSLERIDNDYLLAEGVEETPDSPDKAAKGDIAQND